jgi:hypothetical protein
MNTDNLLLPTLSTAIFIVFTVAVAANSVKGEQEMMFTPADQGGAVMADMSSTEHYSSSSQYQRTVIRLDPSSLKSANILTISAPVGTQLKGQITVNGVVIHRLKGHKASINLSPHLSRGVKTIEISGFYQPKNASVSIKFSSPGSNISQQSGGSGTLRQLLVLEIR